MAFAPQVPPGGAHPHPGNLVLPAANNQGPGAPQIPPSYPAVLNVQVQNFVAPPGPHVVPPPIPAGQLVVKPVSWVPRPQDTRSKDNIAWANYRGTKHRQETAVPVLLWDSRKSQKFPSFLHTRYIRNARNMMPQYMADGEIPQFFYIPGRANNVASVTNDTALVGAIAPSNFAVNQAVGGGIIVTREDYFTRMPHYEVLEHVMDYVSRNVHFELDQFLRKVNGPLLQSMDAPVNAVWAGLPGLPIAQPVVNLAPGNPGHAQHILDLHRLGQALVSALAAGNTNGHGRYFFLFFLFCLHSSRLLHLLFCFLLIAH